MAPPTPAPTPVTLVACRVFSQLNANVILVSLPFEAPRYLPISDLDQQCDFS